MYLKHINSNDYNIDNEFGVQITGLNVVNDVTNWSGDKDMIECKIPQWNDMRQLQENVNVWCYLNFFFFPSVVGKCSYFPNRCHGRTDELSLPQPNHGPNVPL